MGARHASWKQRTVGAALALSVQAVFLLLVLVSRSDHPRPAILGRETILFFPRLAISAPSTIDARGPGRRPPPSAPAPAAPAIPPAAQAVAPPAPSGLAGLGQALSDCAPEKLTNLDEAQRSRCQRLGALPTYDPDAVDLADRIDKVPGAKRWARELARKKAPLLLPCGNAKAFDFVYTGACIIANIANGFTFSEQYVGQPGYSDEPAQSQ